MRRQWEHCGSSREHRSFRLRQAPQAGRSSVKGSGSILPIHSAQSQRLPGRWRGLNIPVEFNRRPRSFARQSSHLPHGPNLGLTPYFSRAMSGGPLFASPQTEWYWPPRDGVSAVVHRGNAPQKDADVGDQASRITTLVTRTMQTLCLARCHNCRPWCAGGVA